jgi:hypothetical protein
MKVNNIPFNHVFSDDYIWNVIHSDNQTGWYDKYRVLMEQLPLPQKRLWQIFRNYADKLLEMNFIVIKADSFAMKTIAATTNDQFCVWPNYPYDSAWKKVNQLFFLPPVADKNRQFPFPVWDGEGLEYDYWCNTLFLPSSVTQNMLYKAFPYSSFFENRWTDLLRIQFLDGIDRLDLLLSEIPWVGISVFLYEPVYYVHFCSKHAISCFHLIIETLQKNNIIFGHIFQDNCKIEWYENGDLGLW